MKCSGRSRGIRPINRWDSFGSVSYTHRVEYQAVVDAAIQYEAPLVGLSALMTTTLQSMEDTIALLHRQNVPCKVMVGGAVLTPDYAQQIGADLDVYKRQIVYHNST